MYHVFFLSLGPRGGRGGGTGVLQKVTMQGQALVLYKLNCSGTVCASIEKISGCSVHSTLCAGLPTALTKRKMHMTLNTHHMLQNICKVYTAASTANHIQKTVRCK